LFGVLQLAYITLGNIDSVNNLLQPLSILKGVNGFNIPLVGSSSSTQPSRIKSIGYNANFLENCNLMLLLMLAEILIAVIIYIISYLAKSIFPSLNQIAKRFLK
jgi:hypothetical protein